MRKIVSLNKNIKTIAKALTVSIRTKGPLSMLVGLLGFAMAFLPMLISLTMEKLTNEIQTIFGMGTSEIKPVIVTFGALAGFYILKAVFDFIKRYFYGIDSLNIQKYIKKSIIEISCRVKYKYIDNYDDFAEKINFAKTYAGVEVANSISSLILILQNLITFGSIVVVLGRVNTWIVIILVAASLPSVYFSYKYKDEEYRGKTKWRQEGTFMIHYFHSSCAHYSMNEVRFFRIFPYLKHKWRNMADAFIKVKNDYTKKHVLFNSIADFLRNAIYIAILLVTSKQIFDNPTIGLGTFMLVFTLSGQMLFVTTRILVDSTNFVSKIRYMNDFFSLEDLEKENIANEKERFNSPQIRYQDVSFSYPNTDIEVLKNINITINNGEKIAVVGDNGSGKTTFVNLLCGMYEPQKGSIKINSDNIIDNLTKTRNTISVVFQDFVKYEASIKYNIQVSDVKKRTDDKELENIAKKTGIYEFVKEQENRFDEIVGSFNDKGNNLSGGQWQKIALARAAYRDNANIMILDEPTAALDPIAESELYKSFSELTGGKTTILISHRLGITSIVDRIIVFKDGEIVEDGSHDELISFKGHYYNMYQAQAQWYK